MAKTYSDKQLGLFTLIFEEQAKNTLDDLAAELGENHTIDELIDKAEAASLLHAPEASALRCAFINQTTGFPKVLRVNDSAYFHEPEGPQSTAELIYGRAVK